MSDSSYTVDYAINAFGFGKYQAWLTVGKFWILLVFSWNCWFHVNFFLGVGMAFIADAMEMMLLSILGPALHCHWHVNHWRIAFLTTIVFLGKWQSEPFFVKSSMVCRVWKLQNFSMYLPNFMCNLSWQI